ncbi:MAG: GNAT family N-acetyltransferase [Lachnospiraceae bacterium]|nr:GNAT family N-acetyltransferase [Lachnospiraceae bacterium]
MHKTPEIKSQLKTLLSLEYNCTPSDFDASENIITIARDIPGRRIYSPEKEFLSMVTLNRNVVITADERMHDWLKVWCADKPGFWLFEHEHLMELEAELQKYGKRLQQSHHMFLPKQQVVEVRRDFEIRWFEQSQLAPLYGKPEFSNALCSCFKPERPDMLAVAAMDGEEIVGLAGCSADTQLFWQIGIDVLPGYRGKGMGTKLVQLLKNETFRRGAIPFYGTSLSNLHSWNIAINAGFYPAWVEIATIENCVENGGIL